MNSTLPAPDKQQNHRLHALCPYFAMFPPSFAKQAILETTKPGDVVLDPFSGRGTTLLEALLNDRQAIASDVNPVAAIVSGAKADPPKLEDVLTRIETHREECSAVDDASLASDAEALPEFFGYAFHRATLNQVLFLRRRLSGARSRADRFIAALCLGHLHGESNKSQNFFSNQMAHTIAMKPAYAVRYWREREMEPPKRDVFDILARKARFRFEHGTPKIRGTVRLGDARCASEIFVEHAGSVAAVITSPPYLDVTNFEEDQWLRLWFLGGKPHPTYGEVSDDDRHQNAERYFDFLSQVWDGIAPLLKRSATIICRIAAKGITPVELGESLSDSIQAVWPRARWISVAESGLRNRQTDVFRPGSVGCGSEFDFRFAV